MLRETYSLYCGGAHPSGGIAGYLVWNLIEDKALEPWDSLLNVPPPPRSTELEGR